MNDPNSGNLIPNHFFESKEAGNKEWLGESSEQLDLDNVYFSNKEEEMITGSGEVYGGENSGYNEEFGYSENYTYGGFNTYGESTDVKSEAKAETDDILNIDNTDNTDNKNSTDVFNYFQQYDHLLAGDPEYPQNPTPNITAKDPNGEGEQFFHSNNNNNNNSNKQSHPLPPSTKVFNPKVISHYVLPQYLPQETTPKIIFKFSFNAAYITSMVYIYIYIYRAHE